MSIIWSEWEKEMEKFNQNVIDNPTDDPDVLGFIESTQYLQEFIKEHPEMKEKLTNIYESQLLIQFMNFAVNGEMLDFPIALASTIDPQKTLEAFARIADIALFMGLAVYESMKKEATEIPAVWVVDENTVKNVKILNDLLSEVDYHDDDWKASFNRQVEALKQLPTLV